MKNIGILFVVSVLAACASGRDEIPPLATPAAATAETESAAPTTPRRIELTVTKQGFEPSPISVRKGQPLELVITRTTEETCARELVLPGYDINQPLPLGEPVTIAFTPTKSGQLRYGCGMDQMISGVLLVD